MQPRKTFDINSPARVNPSATSKPVIVGHQPMMQDPMMRPPVAVAEAQQAHKTKVIAVSDDIKKDLVQTTPLPETSNTAAGAPAAQTLAGALPAATAAEGEPPIEQVIKSQQLAGELPHVPITHHHKRSVHGLLLWLLVAGFLAFFAFYLLADAGLVGGGSKLPFHVFQQAS